MSPLAELLRRRELADHDQLARAEARSRETGHSLGQVLVEQGVLTEAQLVAALAGRLGLGFLDLTETVPDPADLALVPESVCRRHSVLPVALEGGRLLLAMADPANVVAVDDVRALTGRPVRTVAAGRADLLAALDRVHRVEAEVDDIGSALEEAVPEQAGVADVVEEAPLVRLVNLLINQAVADRASDIHIEPTEHDLRVRFRIDGVLHEMMRPPKNLQAGVVSRLKIMSDMDIAERRVPQDGRLSATVGGRRVDLRVATLPTVWGEKVVMRVLDNSTATLDLADLGFRAENYRRWADSFGKPYGMLLVTGPTGSGKSTTLYATLNIVSTPEKNVITVEDPVEYRLPGINQVQVNTRAGLTFAAALRSILRCDPDVVLLGEIRDTETATIAIEAALTGHLVLATLHTNDAPSAVTRLTEMGIEPFLVGSALDCVLAQRLARRLCPRCKEAYTPTADALCSAGFAEADLAGGAPTLFRAVGCPACARTGYRGRLALHEVMPVGEELERLAVQRSSAEVLGRAARAAGMQTLRQDGLAKVLDGATSVEEILRVVA